MSNSVILKKSSQVIAWIMTIAMAAAFAVPTAFAFEARGNTSSAKWVAQTPGATSGGATVVNAAGGDILNFSLTVQNTSPADVFYSADALLDEPAPFEGGHELRIGATDDTVYDSIFDFTYGGPFVNNNRFTTFESGDAIFSGQNLTFNWALKVKDGIADGTYRYRVGMVQEYDAWLGDAPGPGAGGPNNNLGGRSGGTIFWDIVIGSGIATGGGDLNIGIAGDTPADKNVAIGAVDVEMAKISFTSGASDNALISSIAVRRSGLSEDTDVTDLKLYDGATKIGSTQGLNTTTHKATFTGLAWLVPAGTTRTLTLKGTITTTATAGKIITLGIQSAADVILTGGGTVAGTFPAYGNDVTVGGITVGYLDVTAPSSPANADYVSGSTDQDLGAFKFANTGSNPEGFDVNSITLTEVGTSVDSDMSNLRLKINGVQIGTTVPSLTNGKVTFTGSPLFSFASGLNKTVYVTGDITSGVISERKIQFQIEDTDDVIAYGQNSMGVVTITTLNSTTPFASASGNEFTIVQGAMTVVEAATNLGNQTYVIGEEQSEMIKLKFSASAVEGMKITKIIFDENDSAVATDYQNARLYINDSATPIATGGSISTTTVTFEDGNGLFEVPKSGNTYITMKVDISSSASAGDDLNFGLGTDAVDVTNLVIYGLASGDKVPTTSYTLTNVHTDHASIATHVVDDKGDLTVTTGPNTPAADSVAKGTTDLEFSQFRLQATDEAMRVTSLITDFYIGAGTGTASATGDVTNVRLSVWDGAAWVQLGSASSSPSSGVASFNFDHTIAKNTTDTFKIVGDIPTGTAAGSLHADIPGAGTVADDITTTGVSSSADITETGSSTGLLMTIATPTVTVTMSTVPAARSLVTNSTNQLLGRIFFTANDVEDVRLSNVQVSADDAAVDDDGTTSLVSASFSGIWLGADTNGDGTYNLTTNPESLVDAGGSAVDYVIFSGSNFNTPNDWVVPKGGTLVVDILGDVDGSATEWFFGIIDNTTTSIIGAGWISGTNATISGLDHPSGITGTGVTIAAGTLAIVAATDTPTVQQVTMSYTSSREAPTFFRLKMTAANEDIEVDAIRVKVADAGNASEDVNFLSSPGSVRVYEGGTIANNVLTGGTEVGSGVLLPVSSSDAAADIVFDTAVIVPTGGSKYLTLIADLTTSTEGATSGAVPYLGLDRNIQTGIWDATYSGDYNLRAVGVSSNAVVQTTGASILKGSAVYVVKAKLGMAVNSTSPSGTDTERADHTIFKLNVTNTSTDTDARFRAGLSYDTTDDTGWAAIGADTLAADAAAYITTGAVKVSDGADITVDEGLQYDVGDTTTLPNYTRVNFWIRVGKAVTTAGDFVFNVSATTAIETGASAGSINIPTLAANTWYNVDGAITTTGARYFGVIIETDGNSMTTETITLDRVIFYNDKIEIDLSSNAGLFNTASTPSTTPVVYLKDSSNGTTLATGYYSGTGTDALSTSVGRIIFVPTTEMTIPESGKTWDMVVNSDALMIVNSKNLTMSIDLGSASSAGSITAGNVMWNDNSFATTIGWVDSSGSPLSRSLNF